MRDLRFKVVTTEYYGLPGNPVEVGFVGVVVKENQVQQLY